MESVAEDTTERIAETTEQRERRLVRKAGALAISIVIDKEALFMDDDFKQRDTDELMASKTDGKCFYHSELTVHYLLHNEPQTFQTGFVLAGSGTRDTPLRGNWSQHGYAVLRGETGRWYAISPANYDFENPEALLEISEGNSASALLEQIRARDWGRWPDPGTWEKLCAAKTPYLKDDEVLLIGNDEPEGPICQKFSVRAIDVMIMKQNTAPTVTAGHIGAIIDKVRSI